MECHGCIPAATKMTRKSPKSCILWTVVFVDWYFDRAGSLASSWSTTETSTCKLNVTKRRILHSNIDISCHMLKQVYNSMHVWDRGENSTTKSVLSFCCISRSDRKTQTWCWLALTRNIFLKMVNNIVDHLSGNWLATVSFICHNAMELTDDQNSKSPPQTAITIPQHWRVLCSVAANWKYLHSRYRFTSIVNPDEQKKLIDIWMSTQAASNCQQKLNLVLI